MKNFSADSAAIAGVLDNAYFKAIYEGDVTLLGSAFYNNALLFGDVKGQPYYKTLAQYLDGVKNRQSPKDSGKPFKGEILSIKVVNSIAIAEVRVTMYDFIYHEFLSFHKMDGRWVLVNKMISDTATDQSATGTKTILVAYIDILPAFEMEVKNALAVMEAASNKEAGCEQFVVNTRKGSPRSIVIYESYVSDEAFELHKTSPHATKFFEFVKGRIVDDKIEVGFLTAL